MRGQCCTDDGKRRNRGIQARFKDTEDYWRRACAKPLLRCIRIPALAVNARNDFFVPAASLPVASEVGSSVRLWQPLHGGHVGFAQGRMPGHVRAMPQAVAGWLLRHAGASQGPEAELDRAQSAHG